MSSELRVVLHGDADEQDAARVLDGLSKMINVLNALEDSIPSRASHQPHTAWRFSRLALGSVAAGFAPLQLSEGMDDKAITGVFQQVVDGFERAEQGQPLPTAWLPSAVRSAAEITEGLTGTMTLAVVVNGREVRTVEVTDRAAHGFRTAVQSPYTISLGSVKGMLDSITLHDRRQAGLWSDRTGARVAVNFEDHQLDDIRGLLKKRVEVWGECLRNAFGELLSVKLIRFDLLPDTAEDLPLSALVGLASKRNCINGANHSNASVGE